MAGPWEKYRATSQAKPWEKYASEFPSRAAGMTHQQQVDYYRSASSSDKFAEYLANHFADQMQGETPEQAQQRAYGTPMTGPGKMASATAGAADTLTWGLGDEMAGGIDWLRGGSYAKGRDDMRTAQRIWQSDNPKSYLAGQVAGAVLPAVVTAGGSGVAPTLGGRALQGAGMGAAQGGLYGFDSGEGLSNRAIGAGAGAMLGGTVGAAAPAVAAGVGNAFARLINGAPTAATVLSRAANKSGVTQSAIDALGPDGMLIDALGAKGGAMGRRASNLNPDAQQILMDAILGRKAGQNVRLATDLERTSGLPIGNTQGVDALKAAAYQKAQPGITAAYDAARAAGYDLPRTPFQQILDSPLGSHAYEQAADALKNRTATEGLDAASELARWDQAKRILDSKSSVAYRAGDHDAGSQASAMAKLIRETLDNTMQGDEYSAARALRQKAYQTDNAFDMGSQLATGRIPLGLPQQAAKLQGEFSQPLAQGYAAKQVENLLNKNATAGAYAQMTTPQGRLAYGAALGKSAPNIDAAVAREQAFNKTAQAALGNSTTAAQIAAMENPELGAHALGIGKALLTGNVPGFLERSGSLLSRAMASKAQRKMAPEIAKLLVGQSVPTSAPDAATSALIRKILNAAGLTIGGPAAELQSSRSP